MRKVLYRTWRPARFSEVVGQEAVVTTLKNQLRAGRVAHAYILTGIRGTGKTTLAKILAKAVNCEHPEDGEPCCQCDICRGIDSGAVTDVTEIDAASNTGVDDIRALREETAFAPAVAKKRVFIIDEVHMLSASAWAALLKIMEEPPEHVMFILATTEIQKVPATILSRCIRFDLARLTNEQIVSQLNRIAESEGFSIEPAAAHLIARLADGSMRDSLSITEACLDGGSAITLDAVEKRTASADSRTLFAIAEAVAAGDTGEAIALLYSLYAAGSDAARLCSLLTYHFRTLLLCSLKSRALEQELSPEELTRYTEQAGRFSPGQLAGVVRQLAAASDAIYKSPDKRLALEAAVIGLCSPKAAAAPAEPAKAAAGRTGEKRTAAQSTAAAVKPTAKQPPPSAGPMAEQPPSAGRPDGPPAPSAEAAETAAASPKPARPASYAPLAEGIVPLESWDEFVESISNEGVLYGVLAGSAAYVSGKHLLIDAGDQFMNYMRSLPQLKEQLKRLLKERGVWSGGIGPYAPEKAPPASGDPIEQVINRARKLGIPTEIVEEQPDESQTAGRL